MKTFFLLMLFFIILMTACAPQSVATPSSMPVIINTPLITATPEPTQTSEPTPMTIPMTEISLDSCRQIVEAKISSAGILEVLFQDNHKSTLSIISEFWYSDNGQQTSSALWSEDTQKAVPFPLPPDALGPKISSDYRWLLFRRDTGKTQSEFWAIGVDGKTEKKLGAVMLTEEMKVSYPDGNFSLGYGWIPNTDKIFYTVDVFIGTDEYTPAIIDRFVLVDVDSGQAIPLTISPELGKYEFAPDGSQMAILMPGELRVLSTQDGRTQYTIQASLNNPTYSPDGKYIIDFIDEGILRIDAKDGQQKIIPLKYTIMSSRTEGPALPPLPDFKWISDSIFILTSLDSDKRYVFAFATPDPSWTFTVSQVDLASGTTHPIQTFNGNPFQARFSPDMQHLAFLKYQGILPSQTRNLILADLATGEILETIAGAVFTMWFPDSTQYLYETGSPYPQPGKGDPGTGDIVSKHYLGQIGEDEHIPVDGNVLGFGRKWWVDGNRLVTDCKIIYLP